MKTNMRTLPSTDFPGIGSFAILKNLNYPFFVKVAVNLVDILDCKQQLIISSVKISIQMHLNKASNQCMFPFHIITF